MLSVLGALLSCTLVLAACSSSPSTSSTTTTSGHSSSGTSTTGTGSTSQATGTPVTIGMINQENTPAGSFPEIRQAEEAAVGYVNSHGGVSGHPVKLTTCITDGSPSGSASCANQMVANHVLAVSIGIDFGTSGSLPVLTKAGIPMIGGDPLLSPELTSTNAIFFVGGSADAFPDQDAYIGKVLHAKKVSIIYTTNPAGLSAATTFGKTLLIKAGVPATGIKLVGAPATATDFTPAVSAANANNPDVIMVLFAALGCSRIMQAKESLGVQAKMFYPGSCLDATVVKAGGTGANGAYFNSEMVPYNDTSNKQVALYQKVMKAKYGSGAVISAYSQLGFQSVMNLVAVLNTMGNPATLTGAAILAKFKTLVNEPSFMAHTYTCNPVPDPTFPSVCNYENRIVQYTNGQVKDVYGKWISGVTLMTGK